MAKILIVDDELSFREALFFALGKRGHQVTTAVGVEHARELIAAQPFDLVILDVVMPGQTGLELLKSLRATGNTIPVIVYSVQVESSLEKEARKSGAQEVLHKSVSLAVITERIEKVLRSTGFIAPKSTRKKRLLVVDDDKAMRQMLLGFFSQRGYKVAECESGEAALARLDELNPDIVLLDIRMKGINGLETLKRMRGLRPRLAVVMITGDENDEQAHQAMQLGAYGYVLKPFDLPYLELVVASRLAMAENPDIC